MKRNLLYLLSLVLILTSCQDKLDESYEYEAIKSELELGATSLDFISEQQSKSVQIKCNSYWTASVSSSAASWLSVNTNGGKGNGGLTISVSANPSVTSDRSGIITVSDGIKSAMINVTQEHSDEYLTAKRTSLDFVYSGGSSYITIDSNVDWTASSNASWATVSYSSTQLTIQIAENLSYSSRTATVTVKGNSQTVPISISQNGINEPMLNDFSVSSITQTSAVCTFSYKSSDIRIERYGVCYSSTDKEPTTSNDTKSISASSYNGTATLNLSDLTQNTTYYVRSYVTTSIDTTYGYVVQFTTTKSNSPDEGDNPTPNY